MTEDHLYQAIAPSNIACVKYWGKEDAKKQWPANSSFSFTLSKCYTTTKVQVCKDSSQDLLFYAGKLLDPEQKFALKIINQLSYLRQQIGTQEYLRVETKNSFPTGCGIASSASGIAALTLSAVAAFTRSHSFSDLEARGFPRSKLAQLARQGSGSAGRSMFANAALWFKGESPEKQRIEPCLTSVALPIADTIILCDRGEKPVSSSQAHEYVWSSPLFKSRLAGLDEKISTMISLFQQGKFALFGQLLESEALEMHSVSMTATPPVFYLSETSWKVIQWLRTLRQQTDIEAYFTIDAGSNIHVLSKLSEQNRLIEALNQWNPQLDAIADQIGSGPTLESFISEP